MGYQKGDWIRFYNAGVELTLEMEVTVEASMETIPTTDKDSGGWTTAVAGDKDWNCSGSANLDWDAAENITQTYADFVAGAAIAIDVGSANQPKFFSGSGLFNSFSFTGPRNGLATFSFGVKGSGALTEGATT